MDKQQALNYISEVLQNRFDREKFIIFVSNLLNHIERRDVHYSGNLVPEAYRNHINQYWRVGKYISPDDEEMDILIVEVKSLAKLDRARTTLRNFAINRLKQFEKYYSLIAFYSKEDQGADWRFSFVKIEHEAYQDDKGKVKTRTDFTPARRYSFLVGEHESSYTAQKQLLPLLQADTINPPTLENIEAAFSIEKVTDEFFQQYKELYDALFENLKNQALFDSDATEEANSKIDRFAKKLLGQIVFLYFLQKKGWLGVTKEESWGNGHKKFLHNRYDQAIKDTKNYYTDFLNPLFYKALAEKRDGDWYEDFNCKIPFLNGGLFEVDPVWKNLAVMIPNELFHNTTPIKAGETEIGTGILDVFDRYNFTIKEDEPLEKEVAVDPEMLGKVFENMLDVSERKSKGAFYTPREIVHYMCQESLIHYLADSVKQIPKADLEDFIQKGLLYLENDRAAIRAGQKIASGELKTTSLKPELPHSIREHAEILDEKLKNIKICDPAIGSGAFPVGLLHEIVNARLILQAFIQDKQSVYKLKRHCIEQSIYGVDIDPSAIDIARLRLWLSLIVDESDYGKIEALPNLDYKIMQGNSLVEDYDGIKLFNDDFINQQDETEVEIQRLKEYQTKLQAEYFLLHKTDQLSIGKKKQLDKDLGNIAKSLKELMYSDKDKVPLYPHQVFDTISQEKVKAQQLERLHKDFFSECIPAKKAEIRQQISTLEWELIEATLQERNQTDALQKIQTLKQSNEKPFFLWKLNFPEVFKQHGGFDVVIGNPPYIKEYSNRNAFDGLRNSPYYQGKMDLWYLFACHSLDLLKNKTGILAFIATNNWTTNSGASKMRNKIILGAKVEQLIDFGSCMVFKSADIQTMIMLVKNDDTVDNYNLDYRRINTTQASFNDALDLLRKKQTKNNEILQPVIIKSDSINKLLTFSNNQVDIVLQKIQQQGNLYLTKNEVAQGIVPNPDVVTSNAISKIPECKVSKHNIKIGDGVFVVDCGYFKEISQIERNILKPLYEPYELSKYSLPIKSGKEIIYINKTTDVTKIPNIVNHLDKYREIMDNRRENLNARLSFYHLHWPRDESFFTKGEKILSIRKCLIPTFIFTVEPCYVMMSINVIKTDRVNQKFLTALLNSKLIAFWLKNKGKMQGNNYQIDKEPILNIPIKNISEKSNGCHYFDYLVDFIRVAKESNLKLQTAYFEQLIDGLVFELYFADEINAANKPILKHLGDLKPITEDMTAEEKLAVIQSEFDRLNDPSHPVHNHLETLDSVEEVRIIKEALQCK